MLTDTALIHHIRDISLLYLSSTAHPSSSSGSASVIQASQSIVSSPRATTSIVDGPNSRNSSTEGVSHSTNASTSGSSFIHVPHPHLRHKTQASLDGTPVGAQATSSGSTIRQSTIGMRATSLSAKDLDGDDAQDETSWGEGRGRWAGVGSEHEEEVKESARALEGLIAGGSLRPPELHVSP